MEKNIYQILKDWHELLKSGAITKEEFAAKKKELLESENKSGKFSKQEEINSLSNEEQVQLDEEYNATYEELFSKPKWYKQNKYWIGFSILCLASLCAWLIIPKEKELTQEKIISELIKYSIKEFENDTKTKGSWLYEDRKYIDSFYYKQYIGDDEETVLEFYPKYSGYTNAWKSENVDKLQQCISSYSFQFDMAKLNDANRYLGSNVSKLDINNDGKDDYIVDGYFLNCTGGSGSGGRYFLTFLNTDGMLELKDVLITLPLEHTITGSELVVKGEYKSIFNASVYYFDKETNKWIYSETDSRSYSRDN